LASESVGDAFVTQEQIIRADFKHLAELGEGLSVDLFVAVGSDALNRVATEFGSLHKFFNAPTATEALELDIAAVVTEHLDFNRGLCGTGHFALPGTNTIMQPVKSPFHKSMLEVKSCANGCN
jgi:hypothetical protein